MSGRRKLLLGCIAVVAIGLVGWNLRSRPTSDCDTVRELVAYNNEFSRQAKTSAQQTDAGALPAEQYRQWAGRIDTYAAQISDPVLAEKAKTAAGLAARTADLVPKYRARPDDAATAGQYADIGIRYGNSITMLEYLCP